jgi:PHS family inorganic phosphate transporter-like MFS transporter
MNYDFTSRSSDSNTGLVILGSRKEALDKLNNARLGWPHIKACLVSGIGFYTDAYDLFVISLALQMIGYSYYDGKVSKSSE